MNAIVSLVHFCEVDGPSVIFCTQAFHENAIEERATEDFLNIKSNNVGERPPVQASSCSSCAFPLFSIDQSKDQKETMTGKGIDEVKGVEGGEKSDPKKRFNNNCESIKGFKTKDDENPLVTYIGSRYPQHPRLYSALRQACVRSLSCEYCQGREGPVLFGDDKNGYETNFDGDVKDIANEERLEIELRFQQDISNFAENLFDKNKYPNLWQTLSGKIKQIQDTNNKLKVSWIALNDDKSVTVSLPSEKNYAGGLDDMDNDGRVCEIPADTNKNKTNIEKGKWFSGINPGKNSLDSLIEKICEDCDINIGKRHIVNHSMKTTDIIQLTKLGVPFNEIIMMLNNVSYLIDSESSSSPENPKL
ncbi:20007_t:CDS:2, partial [Entrophospora sp. SA101]